MKSLTWFLESPWPAIWLGTLVVGFLAVAYANTRHRGLLVGIAATVLVTACLMLTEWLVVTDAEQVEATLYAAAEAVEANDMPALQAYIAPESTLLRYLASRQLRRVHVTDARVGRDLEVTVNHLTQPPTARADFTGRVSLDNSSRGPTLSGSFVRRFSVSLRQDADRWLITDCDFGGLRNSR